jgi:glycosyltransferase involved in cell wall biosynthesis
MEADVERLRSGERSSDHLMTRAVPQRNRPIRVVHVIDRLVVGGPTKTTIWLTSNLDQSSFRGQLICGTAAYGESDAIASARDAGIEPIVIRQMSREIGFYDIPAFFKLLRSFFKLKPDVVHTHKSKAGALGRIAASVYKWLTPSALWMRPRNCQTIHTFHGHVFHGYFGPLKTKMVVAIERFLARFCTDRIITLSPQQRDDICEKYNVSSRDKVTIVPLAIEIEDLEKGSAGIRSDYGISQDEIVIGAVGRLCEVKNFGLLLRAFAAARRRRQQPILRLVLIGDGHLRECLEQLAFELGINDVVVFAGMRRNASALYGDFDIVALTSLNEGTPATLIEGMVHGRPLIATAVGGVVDLMGERRRTISRYTLWDHGITVASEDTEGFADALTVLVDDASLRHAMGTAGRAFSLDRFDKERLVRDMEALYATIS